MALVSILAEKTQEFSTKFCDIHTKWFVLLFTKHFGILNNLPFQLNDFHL